MLPIIISASVLAVLILTILISIIKIVPQRSIVIIERLGKYQATLEAGFHLIAPFIDKQAYKQSLKEIVIDVPPQMCITRDNISVEIDGILYFRIVDPVKASYGTANFQFAIIQLAQTTMRSEIGKLDLDVTFESRENINTKIVNAVDEASDPWGIKVTRYEIKNIQPPETIRTAMEKQMRAEREKREAIALSEGEKIAKINKAEGDKQEAIKRSEGEKIKRENEAKGQAMAILEVAKATALGLKEIAGVIREDGGKDAISMRIATDWISSFEKLAKTTNSMIIPANVSDMASITAILGNAFSFSKEKKVSE